MITTLIMFLPAVSGELPGLGRCAGTARSAADDHNAAYLLGNRTRGPLPGQHVLHIRRDLDAEAAQHMRKVPDGEVAGVAGQLRKNRRQLGIGGIRHGQSEVSESFRAQVPLVHAHEWNRWTTPTGP
jgi:hypothetical protein